VNFLLSHLHRRRNVQYAHVAIKRADHQEAARIVLAVRIVHATTSAHVMKGDHAMTINHVTTDVHATTVDHATNDAHVMRVVSAMRAVHVTRGDHAKIGSLVRSVNPERSVRVRSVNPERSVSLVRKVVHVRRSAHVSVKVMRLASAKYAVKPEAVPDVAIAGAGVKPRIAMIMMTNSVSL
jgi:hypothetical protein